MMQAEQAAVTAEFESYKVRVHNVLKQQKNKSASQVEHEAFKQERYLRLMKKIPAIPKCRLIF